MSGRIRDILKHRYKSDIEIITDGGGGYHPLNFCSRRDLMEMPTVHCSRALRTKSGNCEKQPAQNKRNAADGC